MKYLKNYFVDYRVTGIYFFSKKQNVNGKIFVSHCNFMQKFEHIKYVSKNDFAIIYGFMHLF